MYGFKMSMRVVFLCHQVYAAGKKSRSNFMKCRTRASIFEKTGSLSNGVDDLENFTSEMEWSFLFPSFSPVFFQFGTVTYQHRLRFRWRGFMYEFLPLIRKARTRCDLCRALHDFARLRLTSQCLPAGNYGWRKCIQRGCLKNTSSVSF